MKVLNSSVTGCTSAPTAWYCCCRTVTMSTRNRLSLLVFMVNDRRRPSFSRTPSPSVSTQPAASRSALALSGSNGQGSIVGSWAQIVEISGWVPTCPCPYRSASTIAWRSLASVSAWRTRLSWKIGSCVFHAM